MVDPHEALRMLQEPQTNVGLFQLDLFRFRFVRNRQGWTYAVDLAPQKGSYLGASPSRPVLLTERKEGVSWERAAQEALLFVKGYAMGVMAQRRWS